ncbi:hypothetical protein CKAH01_05147 [Colletotrichum kahawae]|uniref:Uncharacterized protein n=1 Tax=Colletotrichum kahawae TaxID=34407 RepID=A0AAD9YGF5_COLKA|nr:hypothetical protein CKAH01_05147 [Colletotrichum kahawae]
MPITAFCLSFCLSIQSRPRRPPSLHLRTVDYPRSFIRDRHSTRVGACQRHPCHPKPKSGTRCQVRGSSVTSHFLVVAL